MNLEDLEKAVEVERLVVRPGEALLLRYHGRLSAEAAVSIKKQAERILGVGFPIMVIDETTDPVVVALGAAGDEKIVHLDRP